VIGGLKLKLFIFLRKRKNNILFPRTTSVKNKVFFQQPIFNTLALKERDILTQGKAL